MCFTHGGVIPTAHHFCNGVLRTLGRSLLISRIAISMTEPEVIWARQHRVLEMLQAGLLLEQEIEGLLEATQEIEGVGEAQDEIEDETVLHCGRCGGCLPRSSMDEGLLQGRNSLSVSVPAGSLFREAREILDSFRRFSSSGVVVRQAVIYLLQALGVEALQGPTSCRV